MRLDLYTPDPTADAAAYRTGRYALVIVEERSSLHLAGRRIAVTDRDGAQRVADQARTEYPAGAYRLQISYTDRGQYAGRVIPTAPRLEELGA